MDSEAIQPDEPPPRRDERITATPHAGDALPEIVPCRHCGQPVAAVLDRCPHCNGAMRDEPVAPSSARGSIVAFVGGTTMTLALILLCMGGGRMMLWVFLFSVPQMLLFMGLLLKRDAQGRWRGAEEAGYIVLEIVGWIVIVVGTIGILVMVVTVFVMGRG